MVHCYHSTANYHFKGIALVINLHKSYQQLLGHMISFIVVPSWSPATGKAYVGSGRGRCPLVLGTGCQA